LFRRYRAIFIGVKNIDSLVAKAKANVANRFGSNQNRIAAVENAAAAA
jgi:hypothetical protein